MTETIWRALPPRVDPPPAPVPALSPAAIALQDRLDRMAEYDIATCPALAEAIRRDAREEETR